MPTLEEMARWSNEEIHAQVLARLSPGWTFEHTHVEFTGWCAYIRDAEEVVLWNQLGSMDPRLTLFGAYGWLLSRDTKPVNPMWVRRSQDMPSPRTGKYSLPGLPDTPTPEDLDPEVAQTVYEGDSDPKRR
jgi:hypothetical protein